MTGMPTIAMLIGGTVQLGLKWLFWGSLALVLYTYFGYAVWLYVRLMWRKRTVQTAPIVPTISIVVAAHNEEVYLPRKLNNILQGVDYPPEKIELVVVSDGSTDRTMDVLRAERDPRVKHVALAERQGKPAALNAGMQVATGEIIVFTDARQLMEPGALRAMVANFADTTVGCVSGHLLMGTPGKEREVDGEHFKWSIENRIREWEGYSGSMVGALGAFYGVRRELLAEIPADTILDDCFLPFTIVRRGLRVVFENRARTWDDISFDFRKEFRRKVRTLTGNYQLITIAPWLLTPSNPLLFEFASHKLLRLLAPFALLAILISSLLLPGYLYTIALTIEMVILALALMGMVVRRGGIVTRAAEVALTFVVLNAAAAAALVNFVGRRKPVWAR
jgi:cellulose synthase/poly-beta-1,6-N-acetylglucosamine synthase-like glycosyltransferase